MDVRGRSGYSANDRCRGSTVKGQIIRGAVEGPDQLFYKDVCPDLYQLIEIVASPFSKLTTNLQLEPHKVVPWL